MRFPPEGRMRNSAIMATALVSAALVLMALLALPSVARAESEDACLGCHETETPGIVAYWRESAHPAAEVLCQSCHGPDVEASHEGRAPVGAEVCGQCHKKRYSEHMKSKHAIGMKTGMGCTRNLPQSRETVRTCDHCHEKGSSKPIVDAECAMFLAQTPQMQRQGCSSCHKVEQRCDSCHMKHSTSAAIASDAGTCGTCHMGPDHAQLEMWQTSVHGVLYQSAGQGVAPTCVTCHMDEASHDVSAGIATGRPAGTREQRRATMLSICARCHSSAMAERSLADADDIEVQSRAMVAEAEKIIMELDRDGLLVPSTGQRPEHPLFGNSLVLGPHMLYENLSGVEAEYFRMKMFHYMSAYKGAFHQNPDYAHWFGNAPLKLSLSSIKSEAGALRRMDNLSRRVDNLTSLLNSPGAANAGARDEAEMLKAALRQLKERFLSGELKRDEYDRKRAELLERHGL